MLTRQEVYELQNCCDCYISLHRAEGFGLNLAECMFLGKPVITTNWSGNLDFTTAKNSCLVDYTWMRLDKNYVVYPKGTIWAEADVDQASYYIKKIYNEPEFREKLAKEGQKTILENYSPRVVGELYKNRLAIINR
jgi:glycosyltransferase involved in cell wall biosynthesis